MSRGLPWAVVACALALVAGGLVLFVAGNQPADLGWTTPGPEAGPADAYRSRLQLTFDDERPGVFWTRASALGAGTAALGLIVLAGAVGWSAGRRSSRRHTE